MIKPIVQNKPYCPEFGDILSGNEYIKTAVHCKAGASFKEVFGDIGRGFIPVIQNPWQFLEKINIIIEGLKKTFQYECPFTHNTYYHFIPIAIVVNYNSTVEQYRQPNFENSWDYLFDLEWVLHMCKMPEIDSIQRSMLGHGYTFATLPDDGSGKFIKALIELDNKDHILGYCWEWYNK